MWLFTKTGYVSIVAKPGDIEAGTLTVRSRDKESLETMREDIYKIYEYALGSAEITEKAGTDYKYRMVVSQEEIKRYMVAIVEGITYDNFKSEITANRINSGGDDAGQKWGTALMNIWSHTFDLED